MSDLIERQAAIDALYDWSEHSMTDAEAWHIRQVIGDIKSLPPAEPNCSEIPNNSDCISRQAAIDIERNATVDTNPMHFEAHQKFTQFMDDAEISSFGRWQWSNGFNTALTAVGIDLKKLPSAQPYSEAEIQKMQELEQAELQKAYECGRASAQQERETGEWSVEFSPAYKGGAYCECSQCNYKFAMGAYFEPDEWKFCPNCGADMRGEQDGSD